MAYGDLRPTAAAAQLKEKNVQVIGANCTLGPQALLPVLGELAAVDDVRVSGMPNAGFPKREGDRIVYPKSSPEYFALFAREAAALGVRIGIHVGVDVFVNKLTPAPRRRTSAPWPML